MQRVPAPNHRRHPELNPLVGALYPAQPLHWQILTFLAFAVPFCVSLYKFDLNIAFGVFLITYFIVSVIASFRAAQITRRLRLNEADFLRSMQQQLEANPTSLQDHNATLHLYLSLLDRDFTENDYELLSTLDEVTEKRGASAAQIGSLEAETFDECVQTKKRRSRAASLLKVSTQSLPTPTHSLVNSVNMPVPAPVTSPEAVFNAFEEEAASADDAAEEDAAKPPSRCAICLEPFASQDSVKCLPCTHVYHGDCIDQWLTRKPNCPVCKREIFS